MKDAEFQKRLLATYRVEAQDYLTDMSAGLVELEKVAVGEAQAGVLARIFRQAHSLKGAARSVNAQDMEMLCQGLESVLVRIKSGQLAPGPELLDLLHETLATLQQLLQADSDESKVPQEQVASARERLDYWLKAPATPRRSPEPVATPTTILSRGIVPTPEPNQAEDRVRVISGKLDRVLYQAEELVPAKLATAQRLQELEALLDELALHRKHLRSRRRTPLPSSAQPADRRLETEVFLAQFEKKLGVLTRAAEQDQRQISTLIDSLLEETKEILMVPFASCCEALPAMVRNLAREQGKEAEFVIEGGDTAVDRRILESLKDPLIHLVRNSIDHGVETPAARGAAGKSPRARILLRVQKRSGSMVEIEFGDDGAGLDVEKLRAATNGGEVNEVELKRVIFQPGFSTAPAVTPLSGRGLGLAIVRETIERIGGSIHVHSENGRGTRFLMRLPISLARFRGVLVVAADQRFILPVSSVAAVLQVPWREVRSVQGRETLRIGDETLSARRLADILELPARAAIKRLDTATPAVVLSVGEQRFALLVDEIITEQEVLMKNLGALLARVRHVAGATVLGNGEVVLVLNPGDLVKTALKSRPAGQPPARPLAPKAPRSVLVVEDSITSRTLLKNILQSAGYSVHTAVDGQQAWAVLQSRPVDLIVSDVEMPVLNGFELTEKIRADARLATLPVVLVTALGSLEHRRRGLEAGANGYVVKSSFDQSNLLEVVGGLMPV